MNLLNECSINVQAKVPARQPPIPQYFDKTIEDYNTQNLLESTLHQRALGIARKPSASQPHLNPRLAMAPVRRPSRGQRWQSARTDIHDETNEEESGAWMYESQTMTSARHKSMHMYSPVWIARVYNTNNPHHMDITSSRMVTFS